MVAIVWGTKLRRVSYGYCLTYCPICESPKVARQNLIQVVDHVQGIAVSQGQNYAVESLRPSCGIGQYDFEKVHVPRRKSSDYEALIEFIPETTQEKWQQLAEIHEQRLANKRNLTPEERLQYFVDKAIDFEHHRQIGPMVDSILGSIIDLQVFLLSICCFAYWQLFFYLTKMKNANGLSWLGHLKRQTGYNVEGMLLIFGVVLTLGVIYWALSGLTWRKLHKTFYPHYAKLIAPFSPTPRELRQVKKILRDSELEVGQIWLWVLKRYIKKEQLRLEQQSFGKEN